MSLLKNLKIFQKPTKLYLIMIKDLSTTQYAVFLKRKKGQYVYTTWHGAPLKKMGRDMKNDQSVGCFANKVTMFLNCVYEKNIMSRLTFGKVKTIVLGSPRNDLLFQGNKSIKEELGLPSDKKVVLFDRDTLAVYYKKIHIIPYVSIIRCGNVPL